MALVDHYISPPRVPSMYMLREYEYMPAYKRMYIK